MAGVDLPVRAIREQVAGAVDLVIQQARLKDGSRRITAISEVAGMEGDVITMQDLFTFDYAAGRDENGRFLGGLVSTGLRPKFAEALHDQGIELPQNLFVPGGCSERLPCDAGPEWDGLRLPSPWGWAAGLGRRGERGCASVGSRLHQCAAHGRRRVQRRADGPRWTVCGVDRPEVPQGPGGNEALPGDAQAGGAAQRATMLVVDTSGSMGEAGMATVRSAAAAFLKDVPQDVAVGLVSFAGTAGVDVAPDQDHGRVQKAVNALRSRGETTLYDGVPPPPRVLPRTTTGASCS